MGVKVGSKRKTKARREREDNAIKAETFGMLFNDCTAKSVEIMNFVANLSSEEKTLHFDLFVGAVDCQSVFNRNVETDGGNE